MTYKEFDSMTNFEKLRFNLPAINAYCNNEDIQMFPKYGIINNPVWTDITWLKEDRFTEFMFRVKPKTVKSGVKKMTYQDFQSLNNTEKLKYNLSAIIALANHEDIELLNENNKYVRYHAVYSDRLILYPLRVKPKTVKQWCNIYYEAPNIWTRLFLNQQEADMYKINRVACTEIEVPVEV